MCDIRVMSWHCAGCSALLVKGWNYCPDCGELLPVFNPAIDYKPYHRLYIKAGNDAESEDTK